MYMCILRIVWCHWHRISTASSGIDEGEECWTTSNNVEWCHTGFPKLTKFCGHLSKISPANTDIKSRLYRNNGQSWLLSPGTSSQSEGYNSKWLIWLACREPLPQTVDTQVFPHTLAKFTICYCILHFGHSSLDWVAKFCHYFVHKLLWISAVVQ